MDFIGGLLIGFFVGSIVMGIYLIWFLKFLKKQNYIKFEATEKLKFRN